MEVGKIDERGQMIQLSAIQLQSKMVSAKQTNKKTKRNAIAQAGISTSQQWHHTLSGHFLKNTSNMETMVTWMQHSLIFSVSPALNMGEDSHAVAGRQSCHSGQFGSGWGEVANRPVCVRERGQTVWTLLRGAAQLAQARRWVINICDRDDSSPHSGLKTQRQLRGVMALSSRRPVITCGLSSHADDTPSDTESYFSIFRGNHRLPSNTHQMCL